MRTRLARAARRGHAARARGEDAFPPVPPPFSQREGPTDLRSFRSGDVALPLRVPLALKHDTPSPASPPRLPKARGPPRTSALMKAAKSCSHCLSWSLSKAEPVSPTMMGKRLQPGVPGVPLGQKPSVCRYPNDARHWSQRVSPRKVAWVIEGGYTCGVMTTCGRRAAGARARACVCWRVSRGGAAKHGWLRCDGVRGQAAAGAPTPGRR